MAGSIEGVLLLPVISSSVKSYGYNDETQMLYIEFLDGSIYRYYSVPEEIWSLFQVTPSKGKFIWSSIRDVFEYERIL